MIWPLIKLDLRKVLPIYMATVVVLAWFILITRDILSSANIFVTVLAMAQGWMLAYLIFRDTHNTQVFIFSRPWSRARIFWHRWTLAMTLQAATVLLVYAILAAGARTWLHKSTLPYFPMVERFELSILWPLALASVITFHIIMFLMFRGMVLHATASRWRAVITKVALALLLMVFLGDGDHMVIAGFGGGLNFGHLVIIYAFVLIALCTATSLDCIKHMEIES